MNVGRNYNDPKVSDLSSDESERTGIVINKNRQNAYSYLLCSNVKRVQLWFIRDQHHTSHSNFCKSKSFKDEDRVLRLGIEERNSLSGKFRRARMA